MHRQRILRSLGWIGAGAVLAANLFWGARIYSEEAPRAPRDEAYDSMALLTRVIDSVRRNYVEPSKTGYRDLSYGALRGMLGSLDEHCEFMDPDTFKSMQDDTAGQFGGIGVIVSLRDGVLTVVSPMEDSPGWKAGLLSGDQIIEIEGQPTENMPLTEAVKLMRGEPGTKVKIRYFRPGSGAPTTVEIERSIINIPSVKDAHILSDGIGYLRLVQFDEKTVPELDEAIRKLEGQGLRGLVLDLRNNPGGLLEGAVEVSSRFLPRGSLVVYTQGRDPRLRQTFMVRPGARPRAWPVAVLVNGGSASAAEIVAGALQDHGRGVLVGERTFGKGSVQTILPLEDGSALRLTTARYYTPKDRMIHDQGIEPDIYVPVSLKSWELILRARAGGEEGAPAAAGRAGMPPDIQLDRALDVLKGILQYRAANPGEGRQG